jgi:hypothetical protein
MNNEWKILNNVRSHETLKIPTKKEQEKKITRKMMENLL